MAPHLRSLSFLPSCHSYPTPNSRTYMMALPSQARSAVLQAVGSTYEITSAPLPQPGPGEVLIRLLATGTCHSDVDAHSPKSPEALQPIRPLIGGHEGVGRVVALGVGAEQYRKVGELVGIPFLAWSCGSCEACSQANENLCQRAKYVPGQFPLSSKLRSPLLVRADSLDLLLKGPLPNLRLHPPPTPSQFPRHSPPSKLRHSSAPA